MRTGLVSTPETYTKKRDGKKVTGKIVRFLVFCLLLAALYALFAGEVSLSEAFAGAKAARIFADHAAAAILHAGAASPFANERAASAPLPGAALPWVSVGLAVLVAGFNLFRQSLPRSATGLIDAVFDPMLRVLEGVHSGLIGDYVAWLAVGLALFSITFALS